MFVQGRYEDAIALALESIQIDLSIGGRFQIAKTLTNIGQSYARLGDLPRALAYLRRARDAHERYGDQDGRADTLLIGAAVCLEAGDLDAADQLLGDAAALNAATGNAYDSTHERVVRAALSRARDQPVDAVTFATEARREAERRRSCRSSSTRSRSRPPRASTSARSHAAVLLATTALGAVENLQGCEYGLEIRVLCADVLKRAGSPQAAEATAARRRLRERAPRNASAIARLRRLFARRAIVVSLAAPELMTVAAEPDRSPSQPHSSPPRRLVWAAQHDVFLRHERAAPSSSAPSSRRLAMILSGGGARGAYEVGVLSYIFDELTRMRGAPPRIDILCGTSVGAINACYLAAHLADPVLGLRRLVDLWEELELRRVLGFGVRQVIGIPRLLLGGGGTARGSSTCRRWPSSCSAEISWRAVTRCPAPTAAARAQRLVHRGRDRAHRRLHADVAGPGDPRDAPRRARSSAPTASARSTRSRARRSRSSFRPCGSTNELYLDGGLRQNTPIAPALRLGATHIFAIGSSREVKGVRATKGSHGVEARPARRSSSARS